MNDFLLSVCERLYLCAEILGRRAERRCNRTPEPFLWVDGGLP